MGAATAQGVLDLLKALDDGREITGPYRVRLRRTCLWSLGSDEHIYVTVEGGPRLTWHRRVWPLPLHWRLRGLSIERRLAYLKGIATKKCRTWNLQALLRTGGFGDVYQAEQKLEQLWQQL